MDLIAKTKFKFAVDAMYGSGRGVLTGIFAERGVQFVAIRQELNPLFPGINPEPIEPHTAMLQETVVREKCDAGLATDGDADRIGAVAEDGSFVDSHKIFCVLLRWLLERKKWPGDVVRAFNTTRMLDRIAAKYGRKLHETPIGFKYIADLMMEREILIGGEESGGIGYSRFLPERDGVLNCLLLANVMAEEGKPLGQLVADLQREFGPHYYGRRDLHIPEDMKQSAIQRARAEGTQTLGPLPSAEERSTRRGKVLSGRPDERERRRGVGAVPRVRDRAAAAALHRSVVAGVGQRAAGHRRELRAGTAARLVHGGHRSLDFMADDSNPVQSDSPEARRYNRIRRWLGIADFAIGFRLSDRSAGHGMVGLAARPGLPLGFQNYSLSLFMYLLLLLAISKALGIGLDYYGFSLERRFKLSTQRFRSWAWDEVKGFLVGLVLGGVWSKCCTSRSGNGRNTGGCWLGRCSWACSFFWRSWRRLFCFRSSTSLSRSKTRTCGAAWWC